MNAFAVRKQLTVFAACLIFGWTTPLARAMPPLRVVVRPPQQAAPRPARPPVAAPAGVQPAPRAVPSVTPPRPAPAAAPGPERFPHARPPALPVPSALPRVPALPPSARATLPPAPAPGRLTFNGNLAAQRAFLTPPFRLASVPPAAAALPAQVALAGGAAGSLLSLAALDQALAAAVVRTNLSAVSGAMVNPYPQGAYLPSYAPYGMGTSYPSGGYGGMGASGLGSGRADTAQEVGLYDDYLRPAIVTVTPGTTVRWTNAGRHRHTVTAADGSWDSGPLDPGATYSYTFPQRGAYSYYCRIHGERMRGTVIVD